MPDNINRIRQGMSTGLVALILATAGCSNTMSTVFDPPPPPPMAEETSPPPAPTRQAPALVEPAVQAKTGAPTTAAPQPDRDLEAFLAGWRNAWAGRDVAAYLQHYHPDFKGQTSSPAQWRAARQRVIGRAGQIEIELGQPEIRREGEDRAWLTFDQRYRSSALSDDGLKQLQLRKIDGRWLIEQEVFTPRKR